MDYYNIIACTVYELFYVVESYIQKHNCAKHNVYLWGESAIVLFESVQMYFNIFRSKHRWNRNETQKTRGRKSLKVCQFIFLHRVIYLMSQPKSLLLDPLSETLFSSLVKRNSRRIRQTISSFFSSRHSSHTCYQFFTRNKRVPSIPARRRVYG